MGSCAKQVFSNVTSEQFNCLIQQAKAAGIDISGDEGSASKEGITIAWTFDPGAQTLSLQCMSKPFIVSCGTINGKIHDLVDGCLTAA